MAHSSKGNGWPPQPASALDALVERRPAMALAPARCLVARGCPSHQRACERVCAVAAIEVHGTDAASPGPHLNAAACDRCGLCVRACPAGALEDGDLDLRLAIAIRDQLGQQPGLLFRCDGYLARGGRSRIPVPASDGAVTVPCMGAVGVGLLALAGAWGAQTIGFDDRNCARCARRSGALLARRAAAQAERLLALYSRTVAFVFASRSGARPAREGERGRGRNRRGLLGFVLSGLVGRLVPRTQPSAISSAPRDRLMLKLAIESLGAAEVPLAAKGDAGLWALAASVGCDGCGACAALCPTGALELADGSEAAALRFELVRCTGCALCIVRCPRRALAWRESVEAADLARPPVTLARIERRPCERCEQPVLGEALVCADCRLKCALAAQFSSGERHGREEAR